MGDLLQFPPTKGKVLAKLVFKEDGISVEDVVKHKHGEKVPENFSRLLLISLLLQEKEEEPFASIWNILIDKFEAFNFGDGEIV